MNTIPGATILGFGFNVLGQYDISSLVSQLFTHQTMDAGEFTFNPTQIPYQVPDNTTVIECTGATGGTQVFNTRQQFQSYFSAKAGLSGAYNGFTGQFNAAFSQTFNTDNSYYYCLVEADTTCWQLLLTSQSNAWLSESFLNDSTVQNLPTTFTTENQEQFFQVFRKFGTHFVSKVTVGGKMNYYVAVEESFTSNTTTVQADVALEYKAVFLSAQAAAQTEWKQLTQNWADSRIVKVNSLGGDATSPLNALAPSYGDSDSSLFNTWSSAVMQNPAVIEFGLSPLSSLFTGDTASAVSEALQAYLNGAIVVTANIDYSPNSPAGEAIYTASSSIMVAGNVILPQPAVPAPSPTQSGSTVLPPGGFQVALFDPTTLDQIMSHIYYVDITSLSAMQNIYPEMLHDIQAVTSSNYLAVVAAFGINLINYPSADFANWLASCGASLAEWKNYIGPSGYIDLCSYILIGQKGLLPRNGTESFAVTMWQINPTSNADISAEMLLYGNS
jgi:MAC/Perforin domain-containing protein